MDVSPVSRKAAKECSPRRKPWERIEEQTAPAGRKKNAMGRQIRFWVAQRFQRCDPKQQE
jgi:hypothetical protein